MIPELHLYELTEALLSHKSTSLGEICQVISVNKLLSVQADGAYTSLLIHYWD